MSQPDLFRIPRKPWNAGRMTGAKAPLKPKHIWAIRQHLKSVGSIRDLAMFNIALDAKLRGCDLVRLRLGDVALGGVIRQRSTIVQQKTGRPVPFEITEATREALGHWLERRGRRRDDWLFPSRSRDGQHIGTRQYATAGRCLGEDDRPQPERLWHPQPSTYEGGLNLQEDREPTRQPTLARPRKAREHRPISRHRSGRRAGDF